MENTGTPYTQAELKEAFELVQNAQHWKGPIEAVIPIEKRDVVEAAIPFYTATNAIFRPIQNNPARIYVEAPGYWAGPAN